MNELALFAGAGGGILGGRLLGWRTVCAVEIDPYARSVLLARQRDGCLSRFPIWDDITTFDGRPWRGLIDVISGGFPCQDISVAGRGAGITGERSGLWAEMARVIGEVRPAFALVENSPVLTSRGLGIVLGDLAAMGFDARWGVFSACSVGAAHTRERLFIVANANSTGESDFSWRKGQKARSHIRTFSVSCDWGTPGLPKEHIHKAVHRRTDDVLARGVDRRRAIGNGQVPAVVRLAWEALAWEESDQRDTTEKCHHERHKHAEVTTT